MSTSDEVAALVAAAAPSAGRTTVVAIDGPSGSGKTTFSARLQAALTNVGRPSTIVHLDDLYPGWDGLEQVVPCTLEWILQPLAVGRTPRYHRYDWDAGRYTQWRDVVLADEGDAVLIIEGVGAGSAPCAPFLALVVWVHAPADLRMTRGIDRDGDSYRPNWQRWAAQELALFAREHTAARADVTIDGTSTR